MLSSKKSISKGFTLVELLVIIIIVGVLTGIIMVASGAAINRAKRNADISTVKSLNTATVVYKTDKNLYSKSDVFFDFSTDEDRIRALFENGQISSTPIPTVAGSSFCWKISSQKWVISSDVEPVVPSAHVVTASEITMGTGGETGLMRGSYTGSNTDIIIPNTINGVPVVRIWQDVFNNKGLTAVQIENGILRIHGRAFQGNYLTEIILPNSITRIDQRAFFGNNLTKITIGAGVSTIEDRVFSDNNSFRAAYNIGGAGTYILAGTSWVKQ